MNKKEFNLREALTKQGAELDEKQLRFVAAFETALNGLNEENDKRYADNMAEALRSALGEMPKNEQGEVETIASQIRAISETLDKLEKRTVNKLDNAERLQLRKKLDENKEQILNAIRSGSEFSMSFDALRVAAPHLDTNTFTDAGAFIMPDVENWAMDNEIAKIRFPQNFILNVIRNRQVAKVPEQIIKVEQEPTEGAVAIVAEGGTKPLVQYQFVRSTTDRVKYAGRIEWSEEFEMDNDRLFGEILAMFEEEVIREWQDGLLTTITTNAVAYTTSALDGTLVNPDNGICAVAAASVIDGMNYNADTVVMNPADIVATMFTQDVDGNWRLVPYLQNGQINGMTLISSNKITQGFALIGDSSTYREQHSAFILRFGTYNTQFIDNEKSAIGEVFSLLYIAQLDLPSWMYIDLAAVQASLTVAP